MSRVYSSVPNRDYYTYILHKDAGNVVQVREREREKEVLFCKSVISVTVYNNSLTQLMECKKYQITSNNKHVTIKQYT